MLLVAGQQKSTNVLFNHLCITLTKYGVGQKDKNTPHGCFGQSNVMPLLILLLIKQVFHIMK